MVKRNSMNKTPYDIEHEIEGFHWWFGVRKKFLKSIISSLHLPLECVALDIGCGAGSNLKMIESAGFNIIGLDRSIYALSLVKKKLNVPLINGDLNRLPIRANSIGLIIAADILEHLDNDVNGIREIYRSLREGGILILTVPAFRSLWGVQDIVTGHRRRYSKKEILDKLIHQRFDILKSSYFNFFLFLPILLARRMIYLLGLNVQSENEINSPFINFLLKAIFSLEPHMLKYFSFPFGVSIFCIAKKVG